MGKLWTSFENEHEEAKHYENYNNPPPPGDGVEDFIESPAEMVDDSDTSLQVLEEASKTSLEHISIVQGINASLDGKKVCSEGYMTSLDNYRPVLEQIIGQLGVRRTIPSTEDFINMHRASSAHLIATEGLKEFIKKTWEKVREFFKLFYKKIMLYLKRMVKANLELDDYEKYVESMMGKLRAKASSAKITDAAAFESKLPSLLADEGMESMDTEYLLNYGVRKIDSLLTLMDRIGFKGVGRLNESDGLSLLSLKMQNFINKHGPIARPLGELTKDALELEQTALSLITSVFEHIVTDPRELPEGVYSAIHDAFDRAQMGEGFSVRSLAPHNSGKDNLPKDANIFMAHSADSKSLVSGHISSNTYVRGLTPPPSSFKSLQTLHDFYKSRISKTKVQTADKSLDKTSDLVLKLLNLLAKDFAKMVDSVADKAKSASSQDLATLLIAASAGNPSAGALITEISYKLPGTEEKFALNARYGADFHAFLGIPIEDTDKYRNTIRVSYEEKFTLLFQEEQTSMSAFKEALKEIAATKQGAQAGAGQVDPAQAEQAKEVLKDLSRILTNLLTSLQSILRYVMTSVYGVYTELRYEYVRYLYLSAQRYRIAG